ncbi:MAG: DNA polymerase III subunit gamma/tau [Aggregatilineales bacterium]
MPNQALYLKYRPRVFADMIGQEHITRSLQNALAQNRIRHAYLFSGPRGTGKTTLARILAKAVNCEYADPALRPCDECGPCQAVNEGRYLDLIEIDAASNNGVDDVRELRDKIGFSPNEGRYKVYVIDEVHRFSGAAFDALLKTLEEPPDHAIFVLATTEMDKVPATIKSRCLKFEFRRVPVQTVALRLQQIADFEGVAIDPGALEVVARQGTGSVRDSISLLDQLIADPAATITRADAEQILGAADYQAVGNVAQAIIDQDSAHGLAVLDGALEEGADPRQLAGQLVEHLRNVLLVKIGGATLVDVSDDQRAILVAQAERIGSGSLLRAIRLFNGALGEMRGGWQPQLPLELALVDATRPLIEASAAPEPRSTVRRAAPASEPVADELSEDETVSAPSSLSVTELRRRWPDVIAYLRQSDKNAPLIAQLQHAELRTIEDGQLMLVVPAITFVESLSKNSKALSDGIRRVTKTILKIKVVHGQSAVSDAPMSDEVADFAQRVGAKRVTGDETP